MRRDVRGPGLRRHTGKPLTTTLTPTQVGSYLARFMHDEASFIGG